MNTITGLRVHDVPESSFTLAGMRSNRSRSIAAAPPAPMQIEAASLSSADRRLIRLPAMSERIVAAAQAG